MDKKRKDYLKDLLYYSEKITTIKECIDILDKSGLDDKYLKELWGYVLEMSAMYELNLKRLVAKEGLFAKVSESSLP